MITIQAPATALATNSFYRSASRNAILREAIETTAPEVAALTQQLANLTASAAAIDTVQNLGAVAATVRADLADGKPVSPEIVTEVAAIASEYAALEQAARMLNDIASGIASERDEAVRSASGAILGRLHEQLSTLLTDLPTEVRSAPRDAQGAIAANQVDQYQALEAAAGTYAEIRAAQNTLARATWGIEFGGRPAWWDTLGNIGSPETAWPGFLDWVTRGYALNEHGARTSIPWPPLHTTEAFTWMLDHPDAQPWVPTHDQYTEAVDKLERANSSNIGSLVRTDRKSATLV